MKAGLPAFLATEGGLRGFGRSCLRDGVPQPSTQSVCITPSRDYFICVAVFNLIRTYRVRKHAEAKITGTAYGGETTNELPPLDSRICSPYFGGSSPFSRKFLYQNNAASNACDLLAKRLISTCESTQASNLGSIVTPTLGRTSSFTSTKIPPQKINIHDLISTIIPLCGIKGEQNHEIRTSSGRYRRLEEYRIGGGC